MGETGAGTKGGEWDSGAGVGASDLGPSICVIRGGGFRNSKMMRITSARLVIASM
jgi:hypothetical protein